MEDTDILGADPAIGSGESYNSYTWRSDCEWDPLSSSIATIEEIGYLKDDLYEGTGDPWAGQLRLSG